MVIPPTRKLFLKFFCASVCAFLTSAHAHAITYTSNGHFTYSNIVPVEFDHDAISVSVFPNPSSATNPTLVVTGPAGTTATITVADSEGRLIYSGMESTGTSGSFEMKLSEKTALAPGIYFLTILTGQKTSTEKLIVR